jgi:hypothetical protein
MYKILIFMFLVVISGKALAYDDLSGDLMNEEGGL